MLYSLITSTEVGWECKLNHWLKNWTASPDSTSLLPDEDKLWLSPSGEQCQNPCSGPPSVYQDLSTRHDWPVKNAIVDLPIRMKGNSKRISGNSLSPLGAQNKDLAASSRRY